MAQEILAYFAASFIAIIVMLNPLSTVGVFLSLSKGMKKRERHKIAFRSSLVAFVVLFFFAVSGFWIFNIYSITIDSFRIAGGIALLAIGLNMLFPSENEHKNKSDFGEIYIVPLAIPMASGPATITATVVLAGNVPGLFHQFAFWGALFAACAVNFVALRFSETVDNILGKAGMQALIRIMGLLVASIAVQFIVTGLKGEFPGLAG